MTRSGKFVRLLSFVLAAAGLLGAGPGHADDDVAVWTIMADTLGDGLANWRTMAIMHMAMHDAANAVRPVYQRWAAAEPGEPGAADATPEAALAGAASEVLNELHPARRDDIAATLRRVLAGLPAGPATEAGLALGRAIGKAAVERRRDDGSSRERPFPSSDVPGKWRPTPPDFATSDTDDTRPFLFADRTGVLPRPPPVLGSATYLRDVDEVRRVGGLVGSEATLAQSQAAVFWAYQSSQRGFIRLAVNLLDSTPRAGNMMDHARIMSLLATGMADAAILSWTEKEAFLFWRPVTAINQGGFGVVADPDWRPFIDTPRHPDYPSGHAADCFTAAAILSTLLGPDFGPIDYVALRTGPAPATLAIGMGQHAQPANAGSRSRHYASLAAAAEECSLSRIWAGAHFRSADDEARRLSEIIAAKALAAVPPLAHQATP